MRNFVIVAIALVTLGLDAVGPTGTAVAQEAIASRVALVCTSCHGARIYTQLRASRDEWRRYVYEMMLRGAHIRPEEFEPITDYLASSHGPSSAAAGLPAPPGGTQGEALMNRACTASCHARDLVTAVRRTPDDWDTVLTRMQTHGAKMTNAERQAIAAYLVENFGRK
jgi:hypothetical protein